MGLATAKRAVFEWQHFCEQHTRPDDGYSFSWKQWRVQQEMLYANTRGTILSRRSTPAMLVSIANTLPLERLSMGTLVFTYGFALILMHQEALLRELHM